MAKNRNKSDCGVVAVSVLSGKPYTFVRSKVCKKSIRGGLSYQELVWLAEDCGLTLRRIPRRHKTLGEFCDRHKTGKYLLAVRRFLDGHAVTVIDGVPHNATDFETFEIALVFKVVNTVE